MRRPRSPRSAAEFLRSIPPHHHAALLRLGLDLSDPATTRLFVEGVHAADEAIASQQQWEREHLR
ncbi:hypothetical protein [Sorangium sp. So ce1024]|uniref:hypothetical protein n=1 Tax=unclassified Sorangium TaxID=2621164 RepID=UPI003F109016